MDIENKVAIVTGGVSGIGYACVCELLENGAKFVAIFDNTSENVWLDELYEKFGKSRVKLYDCDISIEDEFQSNFDKVVEKYQNIDILINDAGVVNEVFAGRMIDVNVKGTILGNLIAVKHMGKHKGGSGGVVINVTSVLGLLDFHVMPVYSAANHAIISFTRSMKQNYEKTGVRILAVCPGRTGTEAVTEMSEAVLLDFVDKEEIEEWQKIYTQSPDSVSEAIIKLITDGEPGTVWVAEDDDPPFEIDSTDSHVKKTIQWHKSKIFACWGK